MEDGDGDRAASESGHDEAALLGLHRRAEWELQQFLFAAAEAVGWAATARYGGAGVEPAGRAG